MEQYLTAEVKRGAMYFASVGAVLGIIGAIPLLNCLALPFCASARLPFRSLSAGLWRNGAAQVKWQKARFPAQSPVTIAVLANDTDVDGDGLTVSAVGSAGHGTVVTNTSSVTYTPNALFSGADSFSCTISDGQGGTATAQVAATVTAVNDVPVADDQSVTTAEDTPAAITLTGSDPDNDPLTYRVVGGPGHGSLSGTAPALTYTPAANYHGADSFTFVLNDGQVDSAEASLQLTGPFLARARAEGRRLVYFRFARHPALVAEGR